MPDITEWSVKTVKAPQDIDVTRYLGWTEIDEDLQNCSPDYAALIRQSRLDFAVGDGLRADYWHDPEGVDAIVDIKYINDGIRGHMLDVFIPHDAVVRDGHSLPVYVDIHGGGFVYGYKDLNRNFCAHLASRGFAVISLSYRPYPQADFVGQLTDIMSAFAWVAAHLSEYPVNSNKVFIAGDSAGGTLALYAMLVERNREFAQRLNLAPSGLPICGATLISGLFDLNPYVSRLQCLDTTLHTDRVNDPTSVLDALTPLFFASLSDSIDAASIALEALVKDVDLPPILLCTSSDDFIQQETLKFAAALAGVNAEFELHDWKVAKGYALGHVFPVNMTWLDESQEMLGRIKQFSYSWL